MTPFISNPEQMRRMLLWLLFMATLAATAHPQTWYEARKYYNPAPYASKEHLRFKVKYGFIRLGTIEIRQKLLDSTRYEVSIRSKSAAGLPLIDFDSFNKAVVHSASSRCQYYTIDVKGSNREKVCYRHDAASGRVIMDCVSEKDGETHRSAVRTEPFYDAPGFIMLARCLSAGVSSVTVASVSDGDFRDTRLRFGREREEIDVDAFDDPIRARKIESIASWNMSVAAGLSGNFTLWVSDDDAAVPLRAEVAIALGSITIELESYTREGWPAVGSASISASR
jgi:hypothetical protein